MMVEHALVPNVCISGVSVACATATTNPIDLRALVDAGTTGYVHLKERKEAMGAVYVVAVACARRRRGC